MPRIYPEPSERLGVLAGSVDYSTELDFILLANPTEGTVGAWRRGGKGRSYVFQARFPLAGNRDHQPSSGDEHGPVSYSAERWSMARHLPRLDDAEKCPIQVGGVNHAL